MDAEPVRPATTDVAGSPLEAVDRPIATGVCSLVPVEAGFDCGDAAVGAGLAVVSLVELGSCVLAVVDMAVRVRLAVVPSVAMAEVDNGFSCGVGVASVLGEDVVVSGLV